jgi:hypothetical protein
MVLIPTLQLPWIVLDWSVIKFLLSLYIEIIFRAKVLKSVIVAATSMFYLCLCDCNATAYVVASRNDA